MKGATTLRVTWVDDDVETIKGSAQQLEKFGVKVVALSPDDGELNSQIYWTDVFVVDLNWKNIDAARRVSRNSRAFLQEVSRAKPVPAIVYASAFFSDQTYATIENKVTPLARSTRITKGRLEEITSESEKGNTQKLKEEFYDKIVDVHAEAEALRRRVDEAALTAFSDESVSHVFGVSVAEYEELSLDGKIELTDRAGELTAPLVSTTFRFSNVDWVIVGGLTPVVLDSGDRRNEPSDEDIIDMGRALGRVVFFFSRPEVMN